MTADTYLVDFAQSVLRDAVDSNRSRKLAPNEARAILAHIADLEARAEAAEAKVAAAEERGLVFHTLPDGRLDFCAIREGSRLWDGRVRAEALTAEVALLREALEKIDGAVSAGITETDGPARVKAGGDTRIEDGFIVGQFAIQFELIMRSVQNICRSALSAAPAAPEKPYGRYTCPTCDGGGEIAPSAECPDCDGTGACVLLAPADKGGRDG